MYAIAATSPLPAFMGETMETMNPTVPDETWGALWRGDRAAFSAVFQAHHKAVYNFAFRHTASWATAEEATQACFTTVWRRAREGSLPAITHGSALAWLCGVARNECRNLTRGQTRHLRLVGRAEREPEHTHSNVDDWVAHEASMRRINQVLAQLPDQQREVIEMVAWAGLGMTETAAALKVPVGTVKSRLARARKTLATSEVAHLLGQEA
ncbi:MAG: RNA polymerase sigma factor [Propionibacteriaceae bacterium]|nr:RNA polymerase sigma factor [Propionibacteriaceae bacterium]